MTTPPPPGQWSDPYQQPPAAPTYPGYQAPPPGYGAAAAYGAAPAYGPPVPYVVTRPTNGMALAAMICSLAGVVTFISFPVGAVLGHIALKQVRLTGEQGESYAKVGIIVGWIGTALGVVGCAVYIVFLVAIVNWAGNLPENIPTTELFGLLGG